jgi:hypothetical protein
METIIIQTEPKKAKAIKQFLNALDIKFKTKKAESPYNPELVNKILERAKSAKEGNVVEIDPKNLWGSLGLK